MTKEGWKKAIAEQVRSGKSIAEFCRERGLNPKTFSVNKSVMKKRDFVQVIGARQVEVVLPNGIIVRVDSRDVGAVLGALNA